MMKPIGIALDALAYDMGHDKDDADYLRNHPGNSSEALNSAGARLRKHPKLVSLSDSEFALVMNEVRAEYKKSQALCESPIERTMLAALMTANWYFVANPFVPVYDAAQKGRMPDMPVVIIPQFKVLNYRLDIAIAAKGKSRGMLFAVECDGAEFHDAIADSERDLNLKTIGITTLRVSGSRVYKDPAAAADCIIDHIWFWLSQV